MLTLQDRVDALDDRLAPIFERGGPPLHILKDLHERFSGHQDNTIKTKHLEPITYSRIIEHVTRTHTNAPLHTVEYVRQFSGLGIANFRITSDLNNIDKCTFESTDGMLFVKAYPKYQRNREPFPITNGPNAFPIPFHWRTCIRFDMTKRDCELNYEYDIVELTNRELHTGESLKSLNHFTELCDGLIPEGVKEYNFHLILNHPIIELNAWLPRETISAELLLDGRGYRLYMKPVGDKELELENTTLSHYFLYIDDTYTLNFSRIDKVEIKLHFRNPIGAPIEAIMWSKHTNIIHCKYGLVSLMYA